MRMTKLAALITAVALLLFIAMPSLSWAAEDGKALYAKCAGCHGPDAAGKPAMKAPAVKGKTADDINKALTTAPANAKHGSVKSLTPDQVKAIATYLASLK
jgi:mono/diheme cytochrome c family protein